MVRMKAPPAWEVQVTRGLEDGFEIETHGPFSKSRALSVARRLMAERNPDETAVEVYRSADQQESLQW